MCCCAEGGFATAIDNVLSAQRGIDRSWSRRAASPSRAKIGQYGQMFGLPLDGVLVVVDAERIQEQA